jgi:hypothetical protein
MEICSGCGVMTTGKYLDKPLCYDCYVGAAKTDYSNRPYEFDCIECGRHIMVIVGPVTDRCNMCLNIPGWFNDPALANELDPNQLRKPKTVQ